MIATRTLSVSLLAIVSGASVACGSDAAPAAVTPRAPEALFDVAASGSANGDALLGVWESSAPVRAGNFESLSRLELRADAVTSAARCSSIDGTVTPVVAAGRVAATVTDDAIEASEAVDAKTLLGSDALCKAAFPAGTFPRCPAGATRGSSCFTLEGGVLTVYRGGTGEAFGKIID